MGDIFSIKPLNNVSINYKQIMYLLKLAQKGVLHDTFNKLRYQVMNRNSLSFTFFPGSIFSSCRFELLMVEMQHQFHKDISVR